MAIFLKSVQVNNYRSFAPTNSSKLTIRVPDGVTPGSGLTILVGENGSGKTTLLESIEYLTKNLFSSRTKLEVNDFFDPSEKIVIKGFTIHDFDVKSVYSATNTLAACGFEFKANVRTKDDKSRLVDPLVMDTEFIFKVYPKNDVEKRQNASGPFGADRNPLQIVFFDKNRSKHLVGQKYQTQFGKVLDDLNFQFLKFWMDESETDKRARIDKTIRISDGVHSKVKGKTIDDSIQTIETYLGDLDLKVDFVEFFQPFSTANLYSRKDHTLAQIPIHKMGSGIETFCALIFLENIYSQKGSDVIYCIDEPELHLHPQYRKKVFAYLKELSKTRQIVISTHSSDFLSSETLENVVKVANSKNEVTLSELNTKTVKKLRDNRTYFEHHKSLFFAKQAIFIEGIDDLERYSIFLEKNGMSELIDSLCTLNGKGSVALYKDFCNELGISCMALVDRDYCFETPKWTKKSNVKLLKELQSVYPQFNYDDFIITQAHGEPKQLGGNHNPRTISHNKTEITICDGNILVLSKGAVEEYLNSEGIPVSEVANRELLSIFSYMKEVLAQQI